jgi:RNA 2',3'-cyclic 3'-phosphodiesterase
MGPGELEEAPRSLTVRAFFGLPVPEPQREELGRFIAECALVAPDFRWTPPANLHLTVHFVGNVDRSVVEGVADALAGHQPVAFDIALGGIGTFGRGRVARVLWLGLRAGADAAAALAVQVEAACVRAGLAGEERQFRVHLTLARARGRDGSRLPDLPAPPQLEPWRAGELALYSSRLTRSGAIYEVMRALVLA